jgi:hypothetical protein
MAITFQDLVEIAAETGRSSPLKKFGSEGEKRIAARRKHALPSQASRPQGSLET